MLAELDAVSRSLGKQRFKLFSKIRVWNSLRKYFHEERAPQGLTFGKFLRTLQGLTDKEYGRGMAEKEEFSLKYPNGCRHALHGSLQLRYRAGQALCDSLCGTEWTDFRSGRITRDRRSRTQIETRVSTPLG